MNGCKLKIKDSNSPEGVQKGESAASVQEENEEIVQNEYTKDDEQSLTKGGRLAKYNNIIVYIGEATGDIKGYSLKPIGNEIYVCKFRNG